MLMCSWVTWNFTLAVDYHFSHRVITRMLMIVWQICRNTQCYTYNQNNEQHLLSIQQHQQHLIRATTVFGLSFPLQPDRWWCVGVVAVAGHESSHVTKRNLSQEVKVQTRINITSLKCLCLLKDICPWRSGNICANKILFSLIIAKVSESI